MDINAAGGSNAGISDEKLAALPEYQRSPLYTAAERAALELADAMTATPVDVPDELYARLRTHYTEPQLVELAATGALENYRARLNRVFRIEANALRQRDVHWGPRTLDVDLLFYDDVTITGEALTVPLAVRCGPQTRDPSFGSRHVTSPLSSHK